MSFLCNRTSTANNMALLHIPNMIKLGLLGLFFLAMTLRYTKKVLA